MLLAGKLIDLREIRVGQPRGPDDDVRAALERMKDVVLGAVRLGVLDEDIAGVDESLRGRRVDARREARFVQNVPQHTAGALARYRSDERHIRRLRNRTRQRRAGPPGCARQTHFERHDA